jgi:hypothetical protein
MITINKQSIKAPSLVLSNGADNINLASIDDGGHVNMSVGSHIQVLGTNAETNFTGTVSTSYDTLNITAQNLTAKNDKGTLYSATELSNTLYVPHLNSDEASIQQLNVTGNLAVTGDITLSVANTSLNEELNRLESSITAVNDKQDWTVSTINANSGRIGPVDIKATAVQSYASIATPGVQADTGIFGTVETDSLVVDYLDTATVNTQELTAATGDINAFQAGDVNTSTLTAIEATVNAIHTKTIKADVSGLTLYGLNSQYDYLTFKDTRTALTSKRDVTIKHTGELDSYISLSDAKGISLTTGETTIHNVVQQIGNIQSSIIELTGIDTSVVTSLGQQIINNTSNIAELTTEMSARTLYVDTELEDIKTNVSINASDIRSLIAPPEDITIGEVNPTNPNPGTNEINAIGFGKNTLPADGVNKPVIAIEMTLINSSDIPTYLAIYNYDRAWSGTGGGFRLLAVSKPVTWSAGEVVRWEFETPVVIPTQNFIQMYFLRTPTPPVDGAEAHNLDFVYIKLDTFAGNNNDWGHRYARTWYFGREWDITFIFTEAGRVYALEEQVEANTSAINWLSESNSADSAAKLVDGNSELSLNNGALAMNGINSLSISNDFTTLDMTGMRVLINGADTFVNLESEMITLQTSESSILLSTSRAGGSIGLTAERIHISTMGGYSTSIDTGEGIMNTYLLYSKWNGKDEQIWARIPDNVHVAPNLGALSKGMQRIEFRGYDLPPVIPYIGSGNDYSVLLYNGCVTNLGTLPANSSPITILSIDVAASDNQTDRVREAELWWETTNSSNYGSFNWPSNIKFVSFVPDLRANEAIRTCIRKEPNGTLVCRALYIYDK